MKQRLSLVLKDKGSKVHTIAPGASVTDAVDRMNSHAIGCLIVTDSEQVVGIFTERDVLKRVVAKGLHISTTVEQVMTRPVIDVKPTTTVDEAMTIMTNKRCRHLPVMDGQRLVGMVSIGDLTRWMLRSHAVAVEDLTHYIQGSYPR